MQLLWERNEPAKGEAMSDRDCAIQGGHDYIQQLAPFESKMTQKDRAAWLQLDALVKRYKAEVGKE